MKSISNISNYYTNTNKVKAKEIEEDNQKDLALIYKDDGENLNEKSLR